VVINQDSQISNREDIEIEDQDVIPIELLYRIYLEAKFIISKDIINEHTFLFDDKKMKFFLYLYSKLRNAFL